MPRPSPKRSKKTTASRKATSAAAPASVRTRLDVDERRAQLVVLAVQAFSDRAYDEVSIDALSEAAHISKGLLYHYFPSKRDLYAAALKHTAEELLQATALVEALPPIERLHRGLETYLDFVARRGPAYVALMRGGIGSDPSIASILEATRRAFLSRVVAGIEEDFPDLGIGPVEEAKLAPVLHAGLRGWIGFVEAGSVDWVESHASSSASERAASRQALVMLFSTVLGEVLRLAPPR
ncbi:MAG: TetR/AcrR family transcriptional regulator [Myxococcales bacterium]|nr:TetR/AcrR family transcriptional regulator [Myxococcales bacterium]